MIHSTQGFQRRSPIVLVFGSRAWEAGGFCLRWIATLWPSTSSRWIRAVKSTSVRAIFHIVWSGGAANCGGKPAFQPALVDLPQSHLGRAAAAKIGAPPRD